MPLFVGDAGPHEVGEDADSPVILTYTDLPAVIAAALAISPHVKFEHAYHDGGVPTGYLFTYQPSDGETQTIYVGAKHGVFMDVATQAKIELHLLPRCDYYIYTSDDYNEGGLGQSPLPIASVIKWNLSLSNTALKVYLLHSTASTVSAETIDHLNTKLSAPIQGINDIECLVSVVPKNFETQMHTQRKKESSTFEEIIYGLSELLVNEETGKSILALETVKELCKDTPLLTNLIDLLKSVNPTQPVYQTLLQHPKTCHKVSLLSQMSSTKIFYYAAACMIASGYTPINKYSLNLNADYSAFAFFDSFLNRKILILPPQAIYERGAILTKTKLLLSDTYDCVIAINIEKDFLENLRTLFHEHNIYITDEMLQPSTFGIHMLTLSKIKKQRCFALTSSALENTNVAMATALLEKDHARSVKMAGKALRYVDIKAFLEKFPHENNDELVQIFCVDLNKQLTEFLDQLKKDSDEKPEPGCKKPEPGFCSKNLLVMISQEKLTIKILKENVFDYIEFLREKISHENYDKLKMLYDALRKANIFISEIEKNPPHKPSQHEPQPLELQEYTEFKSIFNESNLLPHLNEVLQNPVELSQLESSLAKPATSAERKLIKPKLTNDFLLTMMLGILNRKNFVIEEVERHFVAKKTVSEFTKVTIILANRISLEEYKQKMADNPHCIVFAFITDTSCQFPFLLYRFGEKYYANGYKQDCVAIEELASTFKEFNEKKFEITYHQKAENGDKNTETFTQRFLAKLQSQNPHLKIINSLQINRMELDELNLKYVRQANKLLAITLPFTTQPVLLRKEGNKIELYMQASDIKVCKSLELDIKESFFAALTKHSDGKDEMSLKVLEYQAPTANDTLTTLYHDLYNALSLCDCFDKEQENILNPAVMTYNWGCKISKESPIPAPNQLKQPISETTTPATLLYNALVDSHCYAGLELVDTINVNEGNIVIYHYQGYDEYSVICPPLSSASSKSNLKTAIAKFANEHETPSFTLKIYCCEPSNEAEAKLYFRFLTGEWYSRTFNTSQLDLEALGFITGIGQMDQSYYAFCNVNFQEATPLEALFFLDGNEEKDKTDSEKATKPFTIKPRLGRASSSTRRGVLSKFFTFSPNKQKLAETPTPRLNQEAIEAMHDKRRESLSSSTAESPISPTPTI